MRRLFGALRHSLQCLGYLVAPLVMRGRLREAISICVRAYKQTTGAASRVGRLDSSPGATRGFITAIDAAAIVPRIDISDDTASAAYWPLRAGSPAYRNAGVTAHFQLPDTTFFQVPKEEPVPLAGRRYAAQFPRPCTPRSARKAVIFPFCGLQALPLLPSTSAFPLAFPLVFPLLFFPACFG